MARKLAVGFTADEHLRRRSFIGGSDANKIAEGDPERLRELWREKTGRIKSADLSGVLPVMMGSWTEELNRYWFELQTGLTVTNEGKRVEHEGIAFLSATLDGEVESEGAIFEAKHVNGFNYNRTKLLSRYMPQLQHNMFVTGRKLAVLSVLVGTQRWEMDWIEFDPFYHVDLLSAERRFWESVTSDRPPN